MGSGAGGQGWRQGGWAAIQCRKQQTYSSVADCLPSSLPL